MKMMMSVMKMVMTTTMMKTMMMMMRSMMSKIMNMNDYNNISIIQQRQTPSDVSIVLECPP